MISRLLLPSAVRLATYSLVRGSRRIRARQIMYSALLWPPTSCPVRPPPSASSPGRPPPSPSPLGRHVAPWLRPSSAPLAFPALHCLRPSPSLAAGTGRNSIRIPPRTPRAIARPLPSPRLESSPFHFVSYFRLLVSVTVAKTTHI